MMTPSGNARVSLGGLLLLFLATRLLYLVLIHPDYLLILPAEELYRGTIAQELLTGLNMPFMDYRADNYAGGSLVVGALASCFFLLLGPTVFALKLAPLLFFTLALVFWFLTLQRHVSERVALYFALIFCFSPPLFTAYSLTAMGFHSESIFFTALSLYLWCEILSARTSARRATALLGFTAGFGLWFSYVYGLTLVALLLCWVWSDDPARLKARLAYFGLFFVVGFAPWILINVQTHFAGLMIHGTTVWDHFGLDHFLEGLSDYRLLVPYQLFASFASFYPADVPRRVVNMSYVILFLVPILVSGFVASKARGTEGTDPTPVRIKFGRFGIVYLCLFALAVQFSNFNHARYHVPVYPFLFFLLAVALVRLEAAFPLSRRRLQAGFLAGIGLLWVVAHTLLFSLDYASLAFSAKGYSARFLTVAYLCPKAMWGCEDQSLLPLEQTPLLSVLSKLAPEDQQELSLEIVSWLPDAVPVDRLAGEFYRIERLIPPGFDKHFYYQLGMTAMFRHHNELPKAIAAVDFLRHRSAASHHLALYGIYRKWPEMLPLDAKPESLAGSAAAVAPEFKPHYWRALGHYAARYWYATNRSLGYFHAHLHSFVPRLEPSAQRYVLQGVGQFLFGQRADRSFFTLPFDPTELERFPQAYQQGLFEGAGRHLQESDLFSWHAWKGDRNPFRRISTKGLSATSLVSIQQGKAQFEALFEGPASSASEGPRHAP